MRAVRAFVARVAGWIGRSRREREFQRELESHLQLHMDDLMRGSHEGDSATGEPRARAGGGDGDGGQHSGGGGGGRYSGGDGHIQPRLSPEEARRQALLKLGGVDQTRDAMRELWSIRWIETIGQDLRYAVRFLRRAPGFSLTAIASLALGLGGSIAIFTVADNLLLRPLPYRDPSRLVMVWEENTGRDGMTRNVISPGNYLDWQSQNDVFDGVAGFREVRSVLAVGTRVEELDAQEISVEFLPLLGVQPVRGRPFTPEEDRPDTDTTVIISYRIWQDWFAGADDAVGRTVLVNARPRTIVGIMPAGFYLGTWAVDLWEPLGLNPATNYRTTQGRWMKCVGRLKPGVDRDEAQAHMTALAQRLEAIDPVFNKNWTAFVEPLRESMVGEVKPALLVLIGAVALLLLVACANVAGLLLARYAARRREIAIRVSLGAGRWRVVRQLLTENIMLGLIGGVSGLVLAKWLIAGLLAFAPRALVRNISIGIDWRIVLFGLTLAVLTAVIFGLAPALVTTRGGLTEATRDNSRSSVGGGTRLRAWLVGAEVALSVILLVGATLLFRSLVGLQGLDPGLNPSNVLTFRISVPPARYDEAHRTQFFTRAIDDLRQLPGVRAASAVSYLPFNGIGAGTWIHFEDQPPAKPGEELIAIVRTVMPGYFQTMGIPLRSGRDFTPADNEPSSPHRFIVNEAFVRKYAPTRPVLAARINVLMNRENPYGDIIGVVGDVKIGPLHEQMMPMVYYPHAHLAYTGMNVTIRTAGEPLALVEAARRAIARIDPAQPIAAPRTMEDVLGETVARQRFSALLMSAFSLASLLLAAVGIYGLLAYSVSQRTREIGVRVALGAEPSRIVRLILGAGARIVLAGTIVGIAGALALVGLLRSLLFGITPRDPLTFVLVPVTLAVVGLIAAALPARRAVRLDPTEALRAD